MHKIFILIFSTFLAANAFNLKFTQGEVQAHTEVFGDNKINPTTNKIESILTINETVESLRGNIIINPLSLKSDKEDRDTNMYELFNVKVHPNISYQIKSITGNHENYTLQGTLTLNGVKKEIFSKAIIEQTINQLNLKGNFSIQLTQFNMQPPSMFFVRVRDQIDINYNLTYTKEKK